jgi:putative transposase
LCENPQDWEYSSVHRFIAQGIYPPDWGKDGRKEKPQGSWDD